MIYTEMIKEYGDRLHRDIHELIILIWRTEKVSKSGGHLSSVQRGKEDGVSLLSLQNTGNDHLKKTQPVCRGHCRGVRMVSKHSTMDNVFTQADL